MTWFYVPDNFSCRIGVASIVTTTISTTAISTTTAAVVADVVSSYECSCITFPHNDVKLKF